MLFSTFYKSNEICFNFNLKKNCMLINAYFDHTFSHIYLTTYFFSENFHIALVILMYFADKFKLTFTPILYLLIS